eukprot:7923960-Alexandrium_andersonii.AAC.1
MLKRRLRRGATLKTGAQSAASAAIARTLAARPRERRPRLCATTRAAPTENAGAARGTAPGGRQAG